MTLLPTELLLLLAFVALCFGFVKAGIPSLGALIAAIVALAFSPREALGICLLFLLTGDFVAVSFYWRLAHFKELKKMILPVLLGIISGGFLLSLLDNEHLGLVIGLTILTLVALEPFRPQLAEWAFKHPRSVRSCSGFLAGVATTIGNAAGSIMALYFLLLKLDKKAFVGTSSVFFLCVNLTKLPIFYFQGLFTPAYFPSMLLVSPLILIGALAGKKFLEWVPQLWFNRIILLCTALAGGWLVLRYFL